MAPIVPEVAELVQLAERVPRAATYTNFVKLRLLEFTWLDQQVEFTNFLSDCNELCEELRCSSEAAARMVGLQLRGPAKEWLHT